MTWTPATENKHVNDRYPNFYGQDGRLYLVRCFVCDPRRGVENWHVAVPAGVCAWCGWYLKKQKEKEGEEASELGHGAD